MSKQLVSFQGEEFAITLPAVFDAIQAALPLIVEYFDLSDRRDKDRVSVVDASRVHKHVGGTYRYNKWLEKTISSCRLTLGKDYFQNEVNPSTEEGRERIAKQGKMMTFFTLHAARKAVLWAQHEDSHLLYDYLDAAGDAITVAFKDQFIAAKKDLRAEKIVSVDALNERNKARDDLKPFTEKAGYPSVYSYQNERAKDEQIKKLRDDLALERQKCNMLENGMKYMRSSKWKQERCEELFAIAQSALERSEREGECYSDPY